MFGNDLGPAVLKMFAIIAVVAIAAVALCWLL